jgi:hypothetical protein
LKTALDKPREIAYIDRHGDGMARLAKGRSPMTKSKRIYALLHLDGRITGFFTALDAARLGMWESSGRDTSYKGVLNNIKPCIPVVYTHGSDVDAMRLSAENNSHRLSGSQLVWATDPVKTRARIVRGYCKYFRLSEAELEAQMQPVEPKELARRIAEAAAAKAARDAQYAAVVERLASQGVVREGGNRHWWNKQMYGAEKELGFRT